MGKDELWHFSQSGVSIVGVRRRVGEMKAVMMWGKLRMKYAQERCTRLHE